MEDDTILDQESDQSLELTKMRENQNKLIVWVVFLAVLNILLFSFTPSKIGRSYLENLFTSAILNILLLNVLGLVFGSLVALFPYKRLSYTLKYLRSFLLVMVFIHSLQLLLIMIMTFS